MGYFVTGATGFIGRHLVERLLARPGTVYALVRAGSEAKLDELRRRFVASPDRLVAVAGDLSAVARRRRRCRRRASRPIDHFFHLAALYDMTAAAERLAAANLAGTKHAIEVSGEAVAFAHLIPGVHWSCARLTGAAPP